MELPDIYCIIFLLNKILDLLQTNKQISDAIILYIDILCSNVIKQNLYNYIIK